ncbi:MAG: NADH-ubiquinone oxidoreductase-F iron-sulfur binding region domain-containing protein, partial [Microthrixaceae bacterium]
MTSPVVLPPDPILTMEDYLRSGGGVGLRTARRFGPDATIEELTAAGLRGRGGGGFPTGAKWRSIRDAGGGPRYVVANGAEGEPATFKDRTLMRRDPFRVVEGAAIAAFAVGATEVYLATKASFTTEAEHLRQAAVALEEAGLLEGLSVHVVLGPDEYLFGEEKALLEVIEGRDPLPRELPPWQHGLFATVSIGWEAGTPRSDEEPTSNPTLVNNVETLAAATHILERGAEWYRSMGTVDSPGTIVVTVVGDVVHPGVHEVEMGTPFQDVLERCGGPVPGRRFKAALSGVSNPVLPASDFDVPLTHEHLKARGSGLGAAGFVVYDDRRSMLAVARELSRFLSVESCGQCPPCKSGSLAITGLLTDLEQGRGGDDDLGQLHSLLRSVTDANRCFLGTEEQIVVSSILRTFPEDVAAGIEGRVHRGAPVLVPLIEELHEDGTVVYDERHRRKRPDWTF